MMKTATVLTQCMMRSGSGCRRCSFRAIDWTVAVDIEDDSAIVGLCNLLQMKMRRKKRANLIPLIAHAACGQYGCEKPFASAAASQIRAALLTGRIAR